MLDTALGVRNTKLNKTCSMPFKKIHRLLVETNVEQNYFHNVRRAITMVLREQKEGAASTSSGNKAADVCPES